jgi:hypothetical protein
LLDHRRAGDGRPDLPLRRKAGTVWGEGVTEKVIWCVVKEFASKAQLGKLAPKDLRRYAEFRTMPHFMRSHAATGMGVVMDSA